MATLVSDLVATLEAIIILSRDQVISGFGRNLFDEWHERIRGAMDHLVSCQRALQMQQDSPQLNKRM